MHKYFSCLCLQLICYRPVGQSIYLSKLRVGLGGIYTRSWIQKGMNRLGAVTATNQTCL